MEKYYYDLHCHTTNSLCGAGTLKSMVQMAKKRGLTGIAVTDHNVVYKGETNIDGIDIIPGVEISVEDDKYHILAYFVKDNIRRNRSIKETAAAVREQGGVMIWAHPLRDKLIFEDQEREIISFVDGLESGNAMNTVAERDAIEKETDNGRLVFTAGSDGHTSGQVGTGVVCVDEKLTEENFIDVLKKGRIIISPSIASFRDVNKKWKVVVSFLKKVLPVNRSVLLKKIFMKMFIRNHLRFNNIFLKRVKISYPLDDREEV